MAGKARSTKGTEKKLTKEERAAYRREAFVRLGEQRLAAFVKRANSIANLGAYPHSPAQAIKVMEVVTESVKRISVAFAPNAKNEEAAISLKD